MARKTPKQKTKKEFMNCAIIGAGQLGSRHLQSLLTVSRFPVVVFVVDPSESSLETAKQRAEEIAHSHSVHFTKNIADLPPHLDFVVVATNSIIRLAVMQELVAQSQVNYLILEKVLFPEIEQYAAAERLVKQHNIKCWVNHPRRMYDDYQKLKSHFSSEKTYAMQVTGAAWGLACNGLHFIDLFEHLTDSQLSTLQTNLLNGLPIESKRNGYLEFEGEIHGTLNNKQAFSIQSLPGNQLLAPSISIMTDDFRVFIQESGTPATYRFEAANNFAPEKDSFSVQYQSQLTGKLLLQLVESGTCDLPDLQHASATHQIFLRAFLQHWNAQTGENNEVLPIT
jgi:predicted dehydrogenase